MGDLRNKAHKEAQTAAIQDWHDRRSEGWTVFHFDFNPRLTHRHLWPGEAARLMLKLTGTRISFWRCSQRGLAIKFQKLATGPYDRPRTWARLVFSTLTDDREAKKELVLDMLFRGIELYRALPNKAFETEVQLIRELLTAPPRVDAPEWLAARDRLDPRSGVLLRTHQSELRHHLLGAEYAGATGTVAISVPLAGE